MVLKVTYIGHATTLIEWNGINILTDPVFSSRVLCFKRIKPLSYDPTTLPKLNAIFLSHAHYDHLDLFSYKYFPGDIPIFVPEGMTKAIAPFVNNPVIELATWARYSLSKDCEICAVPAKHPGGRFIYPLRYRKCHGYIVTVGNENIYFSGDVAYSDLFKNLSQLFPIKLAILSLAHSSQNWFLRSRHMNLEEIMQAWVDLGKPDWIPVHWGTFFRIFGDPHGMINQLKLKSELNPALKEKLHILEASESLTL